MKGVIGCIKAQITRSYFARNRAKVIRENAKDLIRICRRMDKTMWDMEKKERLAYLEAHPLLPKPGAKQLQ